jgi:hypothetical protein
VEGLERTAREKVDKADQEISIVRGLREDFEAEKKQTEESTAFREKEIQDKIEQNQRMLLSIAQEHDRVRAVTIKNAEEKSRMEATEKELQDRILQLSLDRLALEADQLLQKGVESVQKERSDALTNRENFLSEKEAALQRQESSIMGTLSKIKSKEATVRQELEQAEKEILLARELKAKHEAETIALKLERQRIQELEKKIMVQEKVFNNESAIRKRDLDEREARIKSLESKIGG